MGDTSATMPAENTSLRETKQPSVSLMLRLVVWVVFLGLSLSASMFIASYSASPGTGTLIAFYSATAAAYLAVFAHCLMRFAYSRWPSWLLYTAGFGCLIVSRLADLVETLGLVSEPFREPLQLLGFAFLPVAAALLLIGAHASRDRRKGRTVAYFKVIFKVIVVMTATYLVWRAGLLIPIADWLTGMQVHPRLVEGVLSTTALLALLYRTYRLESKAHDEIVTPLCYWSAAMVMVAALSVATSYESQLMWWHGQALELAGTVALLGGLSLVNERAHRQSAEHMSNLEAMQEISWSLVGTSDLLELSSALAKAIADGFDANYVAVYVPGDNGEELAITANCGVEDHSIFVGKICSLRPDRRPGFHNGHTSRAFASGEIQVISDAFSDVEFLPWQVVAREDGIVISVPLPYDERVVGVVNLFIEGVRSVSCDKIRLLESVAAAVSPAIQSARSKLQEDVELPHAA